MKNSLTCSVESKPVKQYVSHTVILPPLVSGVCTNYIGPLNPYCVNVQTHLVLLLMGQAHQVWLLREETTMSMACCGVTHRRTPICKIVHPY